MTGYPRRLIIILLLISSGSSFAEQGFWRDIGPDPNLVSDDVTAIQISDEISSIRYFDSDEQALRSYLDQVPLEQSGDDSYIIRLPMPDGSLASYSIVESPIMESSLAAKYPEITSYIVYGIDDPGSAGRVDLSPKGFRGMIYTPRVGYLSILTGNIRQPSVTSRARARAILLTADFSVGRIS